MASALRPHEAKGWLRIGVLHHNPVIAAIDDNAALQDAAMLEELVAPRLHLLLHGHTHEGKIYSTGPDGLPVLCAGSAGVRQDARADDVPNQYQLVNVTADGFTVYARRYNPARFRWEADTSVGRSPEEWQRYVERSWSGADSVFPSANATGMQDFLAGEPTMRAQRRIAEPDDLLTRVKRICEVLRRAEAEVVQIPGDPPLRYLRVTEAGDAQVSMYPVQVLAGSPAEADVETFRSQVDARYRAGDRTMTSYLVYDGPPASDELCRRAALTRDQRAEPDRVPGLVRPASVRGQAGQRVWKAARSTRPVSTCLSGSRESRGLIAAATARSQTCSATCRNWSPATTAGSSSYWATSGTARPSC